MSSSPTSTDWSGSGSGAGAGAAGAADPLSYPKSAATSMPAGKPFDWTSDCFTGSSSSGSGSGGGVGAVFFGAGTIPLTLITYVKILIALSKTGSTYLSKAILLSMS